MLYKIERGTEYKTLKEGSQKINTLSNFYIKLHCTYWADIQNYPLLNVQFIRA